MEDFKFLDDRDDIKGMEFMEQNMGFNSIFFNVQYYTNFNPDERFQIQMHIYATLGSQNMELEENVNRFKDIMEEFYHRVIIERIELDDIVE